MEQLKEIQEEIKTGCMLVSDQSKLVPASETVNLNLTNLFNAETISDIESTIFILISISDDYLQLARNLLNSRKFDSKNDLFKYRALIFASIKVLLSIVNNLVNIPSSIESSIYLKVAQILYQETTDIDKCQGYLNKSITVSKRTTNLYLQFQGEYFAANIIAMENPRVALKYITGKIDEFKGFGYVHWVRIFELLRIDILLAIEPKRAMVNLEAFNRYTNLHLNLLQFSLLMETNLKLHRGSPQEALEVLAKIKGVRIVQLTAMLLSNELLCSIRLNDLDHSKEVIAKLNLFIQHEISNNIAAWPSDGSFNLEIPIPDTPTTVKSYTFKVNWLTIEELQVLLWLYSGICYLNLYYEKNKAKKYLDTALLLTNKYTAKVEKYSFLVRKPVALNASFDLFKLNTKLMKLKYLKFQIIYYIQTYECLLDEAYEPSPLFKLKHDYSKMTDFEKTYFKTIYVKILYLLAITHQNKGELDQAEQLYSEVITLSSQSDTKMSLKSSKLTYFSLDLSFSNNSYDPKNEFSQLYIFSNVNLLLIVESKLSWLKLSNNLQIESITKQRNIILSKFMRYFDSKNTSGLFLNCESLIIHTKNLLDIMYNQLSHQEIEHISKEILSDKLLKEFSPLLVSVSSLLAVENSPDLITKQKHLFLCFSLSKLSRNLLLRYISGVEISNNFKKFGEYNEAENQNKKNKKLKSQAQELLANLSVP